MTIEDRLRDSLEFKASTVTPSDEAWISIQRRLEVRSAARRVATASLALLVATASFALLWSAFRSGDGSSSNPAGRPQLALRVAATIPINGSLKAVASGPGAIWAASTLSAECGSIEGELALVDRATNEVAGTVQLNVAPTEVVEGLGSVWVGGYTCALPAADELAEFEAMVVRVDPDQMSVEAEIPVGGPEVSGIAADDSSIWVAHSQHDNSASEVVQIDPATDTVSSRFPLSGDAWKILTLRGAVWVSGITDGTPEPEPALLRLDPATGDIVYASAPTTGMFAAGQGTLWTAAPSTALGSSASLSGIAAIRVDPSTGDSVGEPIEVGVGVLFPFAVTEDGVWYLGGQQTATVNLLDPNAGQVLATVDVGDGHNIVATWDDDSRSVWVADIKNDEIIRVAIE